MYREKITSGVTRKLKTEEPNTYKKRKSLLSASTIKALSVLLGIYTVSIGTIYFFDIPQKTDSDDNGMGVFFEENDYQKVNTVPKTSLSDKLTAEYEESVEAAAKSYVDAIKNMLSETAQAGGNKPVFLSNDKVLPINGTVTSGYSLRKNPFYTANSGTEEYEFHNGIDIEAPIGTSVFSYSDGTVVTASASSGYGNYMIISHGDYETLYAHLDTIVAKKGDAVKSGQTIAFSGNTGRSTGPHLHFEVRVGGNAVDPSLYLSSEGEDGI